MAQNVMLPGFSLNNDLADCHVLFCLWYPICWIFAVILCGLATGLVIALVTGRLWLWIGRLARHCERSAKTRMCEALLSMMLECVTTF